MRFKQFLNEGRTPIYTKPAQEILSYFKEKGYDREKQIWFVKSRQDEYPECKKALAILLGNNTSTKEEQKPQEKSNTSSNTFDLENFTVKKKKTGEDKADVIINGVVVGEYSQRRDYVKRKPTDRLRTKMATIRSIYWKTDGIEKLLGRKVPFGEFSNMYGYTSPLDNEYIKSQFYSNAKRVLEKGE